MIEITHIAYISGKQITVSPVSVPTFIEREAITEYLKAIAAQKKLKDETIMVALQRKDEK